MANIRDGLSQTLGFSENLQATDWGNVGVVDAFTDDSLDPPGNSPRVNLGMVYLYRDEAKVGPELGRGHPEANIAIPPNYIGGEKYTATISAETARPSSMHFGVFALWGHDWTVCRDRKCAATLRRRDSPCINCDREAARHLKAWQPPIE